MAGVLFIKLCEDGRNSNHMNGPQHDRKILFDSCNFVYLQFSQRNLNWTIDMCKSHPLCIICLFFLITDLYILLQLALELTDLLLAQLVSTR
jgi:hypothetical protein